MSHQQSSAAYLTHSSVDCPSQMMEVDPVDVTAVDIYVLGSNDKRKSGRAKQAPDVAPVTNRSKKMKKTGGREKIMKGNCLPPLVKKEANREFVASYLAQNLPQDNNTKTLPSDSRLTCTSTTSGSSSKASRSSSFDREANISPTGVSLGVVDEPLNHVKTQKRHKNRSPVTMTDVADDDDICRLSVTEMKALVLESLTPSIRGQIPANAWDRIFSETESVLSDGSPFLKRVRSSGSKDDVADIVSCISSILSRRVSGENASMASDVSALTDPFKSDEIKTSKKSTPSTKKIVQPVRAPEPPIPREPEGRVALDVPAVISLSSSSSSFTCNLDNQKTMDVRKPSVRFTQVKVREYSNVLTLNPAVTSGPSIGLGWDYALEDEEYSLDEFESSRVSNRRDSSSLLLPRHVREDMLLSLGYSQREIADSIRKIARLKNQRKQTVQNLHFSPMEEFLEKTTRRIKRTLFFPARR